MKKHTIKFIGGLIGLFLLGVLAQPVVAQNIVGSTNWYRRGAAMLLNPSTLTAGSASQPIAAGYFTTLTVSSGAGTGDVVGPASSTDNALARWDTTTGKLLQNSTVTLGDTGSFSGISDLAFTGAANTLTLAANSGIMISDVAVSGVDASSHGFAWRVDGNQLFSVSAEGNGAGGIVGRSIGMNGLLSLGNSDLGADFSGMFNISTSAKTGINVGTNVVYFDFGGGTQGLSDEDSTGEMSFALSGASYSFAAPHTIDFAAIFGWQGNMPSQGTNATLTASYGGLLAASNFKATNSSQLALRVPTIASGFGTVTRLSALSVTDSGGLISLGNQTANVTELASMYLESISYVSSTNTRTVDKHATLLVKGAAVNGGNVTLTTNYAILSEAGTNRFVGNTEIGTLTANGLLYAGTNGLLTSTSTLTNGQLLIGSTGLTPTLGTITGTSNQITVTNGAGSITLSTPQNIHTAATPTFAGLTLNAYSTGSVLFTNSSAAVSQDAGSLFYDSTNKSFQVGTSAGSATLHVIQPAKTSGSVAAFSVSGGAHTTLAASTQAIDANFAFNRTVEFATGALSFQQAVAFQTGVTYGAVGASVFSNTLGVSISGAPLAGTNVTITNSAALLVGGNNTRINATNSKNVWIAPFGISTSYGAMTLLSALDISPTGANVTLGDQTATLTQLATINIPAITYVSTTNVRTITSSTALLLNAPVCSTNVTCTNTPLAIDVVTGESRFAGTISPRVSDGAALGTTALMWADLFLASGGVINFNNGNATLTHSAGLITSNVNIAVPDDAYAVGWNGSTNVPTKNAIYDKIETIASPTVGAGTTTTGNVGVGEDDLITVTVSAATLGTDTQTLEAVGAGTFAGTVNNKRVRVRLIEGANNTLVFDSGSLAITSATDWTVSCNIIRVSATTAKAGCNFNTTSATLSAYADTTTTFTYTWANAGTFKVTGEATADNDVAAEFWKVSKVL